MIAAVAAHHCIELGAGIGLPGEPLLGRTRALRTWSAILAAHLATARARSRRADRMLALANGGYQALALQHYLTWPWRLRLGVPILTDAEGLPTRWLPAYNAALLAAISTTTIASATECPTAGIGWHLLGLATLPAQHASARHHLAWLQHRRSVSR